MYARTEYLVARLKTRETVVFLLLLTVAAFLRIHHLERWFPHFYEEATPVFRARDFWGWSSGVFDFNPRFFNYPALSFYIHFAFQAAVAGIGFLTGRIASLAEFRHLLGTEVAWFVLLGRAVTVLFDLGTVLAVFAVGRRLGGGWIGLTAAFFLSFNALHIRRTQFVLVDIPLTFFVVVALFFLMDVLEKGRTIDYAKAGFCIGLAAATKYPAALLVVPLGAAVLPRLVSRSERKTALIGASVSLAVAAFTFLLLNPFCLLDFGLFLDRFSFERTHMAAGHLGHDLEVSSVRFYASSLWKRTGIALIAAGAALFQAVSKRDPKSGLLLVWILSYLTLLSSWKMRAGYYLLPVIAAIFLVGATAVVRAASLIRQPLAKEVVMAAVAGLYLFPQGTELRDYYTTVSTPDTRIQVKEWVEKNIHSRALVALESYTYSSERDSPGPHLLLKIPLVVVHPEGASAFYDLRWYENFDYIIISSYVYQRYLDRSEEFPIQVQFYQDLEQRWRIAKGFESKGMSGPTVVIYQNPESDRPDGEFDQDLYLTLNKMSGTAASFFLARLSGVLREAGLTRRALDVAEMLAGVEKLEPRLPRRAVIVYHELGIKYLQQGNSAGAVQALQRAAELGSENVETYLALGLLLQKNHLPEEALQVFRKTLETELHGASSRTYLQLGEQLNELGDIDASVRALRMALELEPDNLSARLDLAWNLSLQGDLAGAIDEYLLVLERGPNRQAQFSLGLVYLVQGDMQKARAAYARGVEEFGAEEGIRVGAVKNLKHVISLGMRAAEAREILATYWPDALLPKGSSP